MISKEKKVILQQRIIEKESTQIGLSTYNAIWQYSDSTYPEKEFRVKSISNNKVEVLSLEDDLIKY